MIHQEVGCLPCILEVYTEFVSSSSLPALVLLFMEEVLEFFCSLPGVPNSLSCVYGTSVLTSAFWEAHL